MGEMMRLAGGMAGGEGVARGMRLCVGLTQLSASHRRDIRSAEVPVDADDPFFAPFRRVNSRAPRADHPSRLSMAMATSGAGVHSTS